MRTTHQKKAAVDQATGKIAKLSNKLCKNPKSTVAGFFHLFMNRYPYLAKRPVWR